MTSLLNPYLNFKNTARQAMEFYRSVFGGELIVNTFGESRMPHKPSEKDHVMHAMLTAPNGFVLMGSDTPDSMAFTPGSNYSVSLSGTDAAELQGYWDKLSDGAKVAMPLTPAPWGDSFGMLNDKFGTAWMVNITGAKP